MSTPCLKVTEGPGAGQILRLDRPVAHVGRGSGNDLVIDDPNVSRVHIRISRGQGGFFVIDLDSTNGTMVSGLRTNSRTLAEGDEVVLAGNVTLKFTHLDLEPLSLPQDLDESTGTLNQQAWLDRLELDLQRARAENAPLTVALVEIDGYRRLERSRREEIMVALAERIRLTLRTQAILGRLEDGLFSLVLPDISLASAHAPLDALRQDVEDDGQISVCIGACSPGPDALTPPELLDLATGALLQAQSEGPSSLSLHGLLGFGDTHTARKQRRITTRVECLQPVTCRRSQEEWNATVSDVGLMGLRLVGSRSLEAGEVVTLCPPDGNGVPAPVRVVWRKPVRNQFEAGLVYEGQPEQTWLVDLLGQLREFTHPEHERRTAGRSRVQLRAWVGDSLVGQAVNLSLGGTLLATPERLEVGQDVAIRLQAYSAPVLHGKVVHSYQFSPCWFAGVCFQNPDLAHLEKLLTGF